MLAIERGEVGGPQLSPAVIGATLLSFAIPSIQLLFSRTGAPPDTIDATLRLAAYACIAFASATVFRHEDDLRTLGKVILAGATFQALYGIAEYASGHQHIFAVPKRFYLDSATGTFVNRNHYAVFLVSAIPFAGYWAVASRHGRGDTQPPATDAAARLSKIGRRLLAGVSLAALVCAILLSFSRAGILLLLLTALALLVTTLADVKRRAIVVCGAVLLAVLLLWGEARAPGARLLETDLRTTSGENRLTVWSVAVSAPGIPALVGVGLGAFEPWFATRTTPSISERWDHAHNDWLQAFLEGGPGLLIASLCLAWYPVRAAVGPSRPGDGELRRLCAMALGVVLLHAAVDFPLRIPAVGVLAATLLGVALAPAASRGPLSAPRAVRAWQP